MKQLYGNIFTAKFYTTYNCIPNYRLSLIYTETSCFKGLKLNIYENRRLTKFVRAASKRYQKTTHKADVEGLDNKVHYGALFT